MTCSFRLRMIGAVGITFASAFVGGMFYTFGILANDFREIGLYSQSSINIAVGLCYMIGMLIQLPLSSVVRIWPILSSCIGWFCIALGWLGLSLVTLYAPQPIWILSPCACLIGIGVGVSAAPSLEVIASYYDMSSVSYRRTLTAFVCMYALSSCVAGLVYQFASPQAAARTKLVYFCGAQAVLAFIVAFAGCFLFRSNEPDGAKIGVSKYQSLAPTNGDNPVPADDGDEDENSEADILQEEPLGTLGMVWLLVKSPLVWLLLLVSCINYGVSINFYSNSATMLTSVGGTRRMLSGLFISFGVSQLVGRILCGALYTKLTSGPNAVWRRRRGYAISSILLSSCLILLVVAVSSGLWNNVQVFFVYNSINACVYGALWSLVCDIANSRTLLGHARVDFCVIYSYLMIAPGIGPMILDPISGWLYDRNADPVTRECVGTHCYRTYSFVVCASTAVGIALVIAAGMMFHTRYVATKRKLLKRAGDLAAERFDEKSLLLS
jgi:hypothetical protein